MSLTIVFKRGILTAAAKILSPIRWKFPRLTTGGQDSVAFLVRRKYLILNCVLQYFRTMPSLPVDMEPSEDWMEALYPHISYRSLFPTHSNENVSLSSIPWSYVFHTRFAVILYSEQVEQILSTHERRHKRGERDWSYAWPGSAPAVEIP